MNQFNNGNNSKESIEEFLINQGQVLQIESGIAVQVNNVLYIINDF